MKKRFLILFTGIAILLLATGLLVGCQATGTSTGISNQQTGISVSGEGKVTVTPDVANIQLGIQAQATTVADAQNQATQSMNNVMAALTNNGVAQKDIQTQYYNVQQTTTWDTNKQQQIVTGYQVNNIVNVKVRGVDTDLTKAGKVIDAVSLAGGDLTRVSNIQFTLDDPTTYLDQARDKAMANAKDTATQLAKLAGVTLGKPISISESNVSVPPVYPVYAKDSAGTSSSTPISTGELDITLDVQVVYAIQ
jgi:uncharacterized protein YggE